MNVGLMEIGIVQRAAQVSVKIFYRTSVSTNFTNPNHFNLGMLSLY